MDYLAQLGDPADSLRSRLEQSYALYNKHEGQLSEYFLKRLSS
ncbi:hypothetical protein O9929_20330 [Vibrio lentus]|nr:hypothetical protein [Vibrio lentus]